MDVLKSLRESLVAYYPFKEDLLDHSGVSRHALSSAPRYVDGRFGSAARIAAEGTSPIGIPPLPTDTQWTLSFWLRIESAASSTRVFGASTDPYSVSAVVHHGSLRLFGTHYRHQTDRWEAKIDAGFRSGIWHHIVLVRDRDGCLNVYVDCERVARNLTTGPQFINPTRVGFSFAGTGNQTESTFDIGDVMVFSQAHGQGAVNVLGGAIAFRTPPRPVDDALASPLIVVPIFVLLAAVTPVVVKYILRQRSSARKAPAAIADAIREALRISPGRKLTRADVGLADDDRVHLDIGGEGYHADPDGFESGFGGALNLNDREVRTDDPTQPIPSLVRVARWADQPGYPFADGFADYITMQRAPLTPKNVEEIARCLRPGGEVGLWIDQPEHAQNLIEALAARLNSTPQFRAQNTQADGRTRLDKTLIRSLVPPPEIFVFHPSPRSHVQKIVIERASASYWLTTGKGVERLGWAMHTKDPRHCGMIRNIIETDPHHNELFFHSPGGVLIRATLDWEHCHYVHGANDVPAKLVPLEDVRAIARVVRGEFLEPRQPFSGPLLADEDCVALEIDYAEFWQRQP